ncbi:MAG TPA: acetyl-CoA C-acyltransferase FadI [Thermoanaerobaculia bacterium]|nr:acetyl-CoA C-acyltransferase FadI [Thermoanaerobaculia bacterium]
MPESGDSGESGESGENEEQVEPPRQAQAPQPGPPAPLRPENRASALEEMRDRADTVWTHAAGDGRDGRNGKGTPRSGPGRAAAVTGTGREQLRGPHGRVAIVDGCRTPFVRAGTQFQGMDVVDLAGAATAELVVRTAIDPELIDLSVYGVVVPALNAPNLGREVVFRSSLPMKVPGVTVNLACASSSRAMTFVAEAILAGECEVALAGGAESLSNVPVQFSRRAAHAFMELSRAKTLPQRFGILSRLRPKDLAPVAPAIAEYTTGMTMGESAEKMAKENDISRRSQDEIALLSHQRAAAATADGRLAAQIAPVFPPPRYGAAVTQDNGIRSDTSLDALGKLKPVFDRRYGTLTAGNSSPLTDGGSAVLMMSEERAKSLGYTPLGYIRSYAYAAVDPGEQLLQGPAYAAPAALDGAGLKLADVDLIEMHEAFAAQILSNMKAFASAKFAREELGRSEPLGEIDLERFNVTGGSIAIGHPFGATGARVATQLLCELRRRGANLGLLTVCAAGGVGFAMVVERE